MLTNHDNPFSHIDSFLTFIKSQASSEERYHSSGEYTGGNHIHYGLRAPIMHGFVKEWVAEHKKSLTYDDWEGLLDSLYHGHSFEERAMAGMVLSRFPKFRLELPLELFDEWLTGLEGWAEVDSTCQTVFTAKDFNARWGEWEPFLRQLVVSQNINKRRASLVLLIKPIRDTDDQKFLNLGLEFVDQLKREKDKLITKAISWILRESIKQHRKAVHQYVEANADGLPAIAVREFRKKYETGKK